MHLREAKQCFTPCLTRSPSSWSHEVDVLYFQYQCYRLGQNSKLVKLFQIPFLRKIFSFKPLVQNLEKSHIHDTQSTATHHTLTQNLPKKENMYSSLLYRCVFFCLGLLKLIFFDTGSVGFAHFEVDFFVLQQFLRQKGTKPPNFDRTCPAFCQKRPKKPQRIMVNQSRLLFLHKK